MPRERNLAGLATISLPSRASARVALAPLSSRLWAGPAGSRSGGLLYKADLLCSSN